MRFHTIVDEPRHPAEQSRWPHLIETEGEGKSFWRVQYNRHLLSSATITVGKGADDQEVPTGPSRNLTWSAARR